MPIPRLKRPFFSLWDTLLFQPISSAPFSIHSLRAQLPIRHRSSRFTFSESFKGRMCFSGFNMIYFSKFHRIHSDCIGHHIHHRFDSKKCLGCTKTSVCTANRQISIYCLCIKNEYCLPIYNGKVLLPQQLITVKPVSTISSGIIYSIHSQSRLFPHRFFTPYLIRNLIGCLVLP